MRLTVVGNPTNRRVTSFSAAAVAAGLPPPTVLPWRDVLTGAPPPTGLVRIDSAGEDPEVDYLLRAAGAAPAPSHAFTPARTFAPASAADPGVRPARHGEILGLTAAYHGLMAAVGQVASGGATLLNDPGDIAFMCDKRLCHARLSAAGIPVPAALPFTGGYAALRAAMAAAGMSRVFVKPAHGSSASGVVALAVAPGRVRAVTSVELTPDGLFNSLKVRDHTDEPTVAALVDRLSADTLHGERWLPKAGLHNRVLDLRVVAIAGRPTHIVVRTAKGPLTNLHLGNARGSAEAVKAAAGPRNWSAAMETCERVAALFPRSLHVGIDLMFLAGWRHHAVAEVNAFGDLLPGVLRDGRDTYAEQIDALRTGRWRPAALPNPSHADRHTAGQRAATLPPFHGFPFRDLVDLDPSGGPREGVRLCGR